MDANGLPIAFGKQANTLPPRPEQPKANKHENQGSSRGGSSGRGQRGTVGGGKRSRVRPDRKGNAPPKGGKDGGAEDEVKQAPPQPQAPLEGPADYSSRTNALNSGIKRPHPPSPQDGEAGHQEFSRQRGPGGFGNGRGQGRGRGGGGGGRGRGGGEWGGGSRRNPIEEPGGLWKASFTQDPWKRLIEARRNGDDGATAAGA